MVLENSSNPVIPSHPQNFLIFKGMPLLSQKVAAQSPRFHNQGEMKRSSNQGSDPDRQSRIAMLSITYMRAWLKHPRKTCPADPSDMLFGTDQNPKSRNLKSKPDFGGWGADGERGYGGLREALLGALNWRLFSQAFGAPKGETD